MKEYIEVKNTPIYFDKLNHQTLNPMIVGMSMIGIMIYALVYFLWGERIPLHDGVGMDGQIYAAYATNFIHEITTTSDVYHVTRIFPSLLIYCFSKILGLSLATPQKICAAFYCLNVMVFLGTAYFWYKICKLKAFNDSIYLIGFISLFINYACLKLAFYVPVLTDQSVLFFGIWTLYLYLRQKYLFICILLLPVFFTWPIAIALSMPLVIYTSSDKSILNQSSWQKTGASLIVVLFISCALSLLYILLFHTDWVPGWESVLFCWRYVRWGPHRHLFSWSILVTASLLIACVYVYYVALYSNILNVLRNTYKISLSNTAAYVLIMVVYTGIASWLSHLSINYTGKTVFSSAEFLAITLLGSFAKPALSLIMQITFWGPCAILWLYCMKEQFKNANEETFGLLLFVLITYFMALNAHARQLTFNIPFMVYIVCKTLNNLHRIQNKTKFLLTYTLAALVGSKIYYIINLAPFQSLLGSSYQRFSMNSGLWTRWYGYFFNLELALIMCLLLYWGFYKNLKTAQSTL